MEGMELVTSPTSSRSQISDPSAAEAAGAPARKVAIASFLRSMASDEAALPVALLGIPFDPMTIDRAVERISAMIDQVSFHHVVTANVDFLVQASRDSELRRILFDAELVLCDGTPLVWASRWLGNALPGRAAGSDLVPALVRRAAVRRWRIFLLGGADGVAEEASRRLAAQYPDLPKIAYFAPVHAPLERMDNDEIAAHIRAAKPDLLLVSFGCPKQEKWIARHARDLGVPVAIGVGATVDFLAGRVRRAPVWMRRCGLEWGYRLLQEPRRLFRRYVDDLFHFIPEIVAQRWWTRPGAASKRLARRSVAILAGQWLRVRAGDELDADGLRREGRFWSSAVSQTRDCLLDLAGVRHIDSTGLAVLARWRKRLADNNRRLVLFRPSAVVRGALERMRLLHLFVISDKNPDARGKKDDGKDRVARMQDVIRR